MKVNNAGTKPFAQFLLPVFCLVIVFGVENGKGSNATLLMMPVLPIGIASFMTMDAEPIWTKRLTAKI